VSILYRFRVGQLFVNSRHFNLPNLHLAPSLGDPIRIAEIIGIRKLEYLGYHVALIVWSYI